MPEGTKRVASMDGLVQFGRWVWGGFVVLCLFVVANLLVLVVPDIVRRESLRSGSLYQSLATSVVTTALGLAVLFLYRTHWGFLLLLLLLGVSFGTYYFAGLDGAIGLGVPLGLVLTAFYIALYFILVRGTGRQILQSDRFLNTTRRCAVVAGVAQLLLAAIPVWTLVDLGLYGTAMRPFAFAFAITFIALQVAVLFLAWTLQRSPQRNLHLLAATYVLGLAACGLVAIANNSDLTLWILQPEAVLPPNEIMGRSWCVYLAVAAFVLAQVLGIVPLTLVVLRLVSGSPAERRADAANSNSEGQTRKR